MHRDLNCPSASSINQSINQSIISYSIPAHYHGRSFNHHPSWLIPWSFIIHPSIRLSSAQPTLPRVVSGSLRRHFLGAFGSCAGLWWAVFPSGVSVSTAARSDALAVAHLPSRLASLGDYQPTGSAHIDLPLIDSWHRHRRKQNWTNFQLPASSAALEASLPSALDFASHGDYRQWILSNQRQLLHRNLAE
ncbi:hypothetical protein SMAC4_14066 [Sordaria macrospora]|uniref:uncharacterized protein n=1 Tax=Sordaria macrospora TaxID=5147 RepID=UPI002B31AE9B|nr:hypothetical protein SMAC4_14066 [Sordaria macrospora]